MGSSLEDFALEALTAVVGQGETNDFLINKLVRRGRNRPHPWSTRYDYICWSGLTDRTFNARLLPPKPYPGVDAMGTRRPPAPEVAKLFVAAKGGQRVCPKSTCLFPAFAQYLTDGFIRTQVSNDPPFGTGVEDRRRTTSNHEIDQSPLYGRNEAQTGVLRLKSSAVGMKGRLKTQKIGNEEFPLYLFDGAGQIKAEFCAANGTPILDLPLGISKGLPSIKTLFAVGGDRANATPQVAMINVLFLREHNRLAGMLERQNPGWDDERVFQIARNILIVMFIKIVVEEYINHINTSVFKFRADPKVAWTADWNRPNWMTAEFSLLYRWHSLIPETFRWGGQVVPGLQLLLDNSLLIRDGLATSFAEVSSNNATELGLGNSATFLMRAEEKAVEQARLNSVATINDYRRAMDLAPAKNFTDLVGKTKDPAEKSRRSALATKLQQLYGSVENVEFYVGMFAEPRATNGPLPELILAMVAMDAFSQALTNPLLSEHVYGNAENRRLAFTPAGLVEIENTKRLRDVLIRNATAVSDRFVGMTRRDWQRD